MQYIDIKKILTTSILALFVILLVTPLPTALAVDVYSYQFNGPYDENTAASIAQNVTVSIYWADGSGIYTAGYFDFNGTITHTTDPGAPKPMFFSYNLSNIYGTNITREYWLSPSETNITNTASSVGLYIYAPTDPTLISFSIFNYRSIAAFSDGALLTVRSLINLPNTIIEKRLVDSLGTVSVMLQPNTPYDVTIESISTGETYNLGTINTATSVITLNVPASAFPSNIVNLYTYSYAWAYREFSSNSIMIQYEDTTNSTSTLEIIISDPTNSTVYFDQSFGNETYDVNEFNYAWNYAVNETSYNVWVVVNSTTAGTYYFKQYLQGIYDQASNPFDFSFMGSINGLDAAIFLPAFIIIACAGAFNQVNAEIAAFLTTIVAIVLAAIGWISISSSMIVVALSLSILAGIVTARRRFG